MLVILDLVPVLGSSITSFHPCTTSYHQDHQKELSGGNLLQLIPNLHEALKLLLSTKLTPGLQNFTKPSNRSFLQRSCILVIPSQLEVTKSSFQSVSNNHIYYCISTSIPKLASANPFSLHSPLHGPSMKERNHLL